MQVRAYRSYAELAANAAGLFPDAGAGGLFRSRAWLENFERNGLRPGDQLRLFSVELDGRPVALAPALYSRLYAAHRHARVLHFLQPDEQPYELLLAGVSAREVAESLAGWLAANRQAYDVVRAGPFDAHSPFLEALVPALRAARHPLQRYAHFSDRYESVAGMSFKDYLARRPRELRESLERNARLLLQGGRGRFHLARTPELLEDSWGSVRRIADAAPREGEPEPPGYLPSAMALAAEAGALRLGIFLLDDVPQAMQLWVVDGGAARCLRIWEVREARPFPIDAVLTQMMALCLIDGDRVSELDFGAVSEAFAREWAPAARPRIALAAFNPRTWRGLRGAARHVAGQTLRALRSRLFRTGTRAPPA